MSHLSHVKQMLSQPLHLTHELILCTQIARKRPDFTVKVLAGTEFCTCDLPTQIFFDLQLYLPDRIWPFSWLHIVGPHSSGQYHFGAVANKLSGTKSRLYTLKEFAAHLLGLHAPATEPSFGFCQQYLELPSSLPSKYYPSPMLLNFSVGMGTGYSNRAWSPHSIIILFRFS